MHNLTLWGQEQCEKFIKRVKVGMPCYIQGHIRYKEPEEKGKGNELLRYADIIIEYWQELVSIDVANANPTVSYPVRRPDRSEETISKAFEAQARAVDKSTMQKELEQVPPEA